jgi:hypothetical protein
MKKFVVLIICFLVIGFAIACSGVYPATHAHDMANIYFNFKMNCCAGSSITIVDLNSGEQITFFQSSHGPNSSCANDAFIV